MNKDTCYRGSTSVQHTPMQQKEIWELGSEATKNFARRRSSWSPAHNSDNCGVLVRHTQATRKERGRKKKSVKDLYSSELGPFAKQSLGVDGVASVTLTGPRTKANCLVKDLISSPAPSHRPDDTDEKRTDPLAGMQRRPKTTCARCHADEEAHVPQSILWQSREL